MDFLEIWGGGRTLSTSVLLRRVSGTVQDALAEAPLVVSPNNMAIVRFASDASVTDSGFRIRWRSGEFRVVQLMTSLLKDAVLRLYNVYCRQNRLF